MELLPERAPGSARLRPCLFVMLPCKLTRFNCNTSWGGWEFSFFFFFAMIPSIPARPVTDRQAGCVCLAGWAGISLEEALTWIIQQPVGKNNPARGSAIDLTPKQRRRYAFAGWRNDAAIETPAEAQRVSRHWWEAATEALREFLPAFIILILITPRGISATVAAN